MGSLTDSLLDDAAVAVLIHSQMNDHKMGNFHLTAKKAFKNSNQLS
jgi:hypothetical protein